MKNVTTVQKPELSAAKRGLLEKRLRAAFHSPAAGTSIPRRAQSGPAPLSFAQQRLWFIQQLEPNSAAYNVPTALRLKGPLQVAALNQSLEEVVRRHEILRTAFPAVDGKPQQVVQPHAPMLLPIVSLEDASPKDRETTLQRLILSEGKRPFDLSRGPVLRWTLYRLSPEDHLLLLVMHHIVSDGWSMAVFFQELERFYSGITQGKVIRGEELPIQYSDYAAWQHEVMGGATLKKHLDYWKGKLAGAPPAIALPTSPKHLGLNAPQGECRSLLVPKAFKTELESFSQRHGASAFMTMVTALDLLLWRWTGQDDLVIGTVVAGRNQPEIEKLIGCFMNFLPLRARISSSATGLQLLEQVKTTVFEAHSHQDCPFEKIVEAINPARRHNQNPLYNVGFLLQNFPIGALQSQTLQATFLPSDTQTALLDLRFVSEVTDKGMVLFCEYDSRLFNAETIDALLQGFQCFVEKLIHAPETSAEAFPLPESLREQRDAAGTTAQSQKLVVSSTFTAEPVADSINFWVKRLALPLSVEFAPYNQVFQQLLEKTSLVLGNPRGMNALLIRLEDWLPQEDSLNGTDVPGGKLERSVREFIGAVKSAASRTTTPFLIFLCPSNSPRSRMPEIRENIEAAERRIFAELSAASGVHVMKSADIEAAYPVTDIYDRQADQLGHVPYTPTFFGVLGTLIVRRFDALKRPARKVVALDCDQTLWSGVCGEDGACGIRLEPARIDLQDFMRSQADAGMLLTICSKNNEEDVNEVFRQNKNMPLRLEHFAGRKVNWRPKSENLKALARELRLGLDSFIFVDDNPMECAEVEASCPGVLALQLPELNEEVNSFLKNVWAFDHLKLTAEDKQRTLLYQQNQKREQFQAESLSFADFLAGLNLHIQIEEPRPEQLARVAQLTQRTNQFNFTTVRRSETEVQLLAKDPKYKLIAVSVRDRFGDYGLVGVVISSFSQNSLEVDTFLLSCRVLGKGVEHRILSHLGQLAQENGKGRVDIRFIPTQKNKPALDFLEGIGGSFRHGSAGTFHFRLPSEYAANIQLNPENLPSSTQDSQGDNAKQEISGRKEFYPGIRPGDYSWIARNAATAEQILKLVQAQNTPVVAVQEEYVAPRNETERQLCDLWQELLGLPRVGVKDDFFALGGTSLLAVRLFAQIEKTMGKALPLVTLFQAPSIEQIAAVLRRRKQAPPSALVAIQPKGSRPPLILVHGAGGGLLWGYANLASNLSPDQPVYGIEPKPGQESATVEDLARRYFQALRTFQPHGPYYIGGYCFGGYVAYEMARLAVEQNEKVALLALIDSAAPNGSYDQVPWWRPTFLPKFVRNSSYWLQDFMEQTPGERKEFFDRKLGVLKRKITSKLLRKREDSEVDLAAFIDASQFPEGELKLWQVHLKAGSSYVPKAYPGRVTLIRTRGQPFFCSLDPKYGWSELAEGGVDVRIIPGSHEKIFVEPDVKFLAQTLDLCLNEVQAKQPIKTLETV
ncbi:MAG TPA: HAD-IIIC family phosphatase [Candidatus Saccharimonadales bacterium]|nr:HAD-IIIC family phosphatase [Candidatus Saccharimonadales bacterium]